MTARYRIVSVPDMTPEEWGSVEVGSELVATMPPGGGPVVLRLNDAYLLRAMWPALVAEGDAIEWCVDQPGSKEDFRVVLQVATVVAAIWFPAAAPYLAAASVAYNLLVPPTVLRQPDDDSKNLYNANLSGNAARLDDPIWRTMGIDNITPPFAAQPYYFYDENYDQFYVAVFCLGYGPMQILGEFIGKTPLTHFADIVSAEYLAPGELPTVAQANMVTSIEVDNMELEVGRFVGGYVGCQPGRKVHRVFCNFQCPQGLGKPATEDSDDTTVTVTARMEYREISDGGAPIGDWKLLFTTSKTLSTNVQVRWTEEATLVTDARIEVRGGRSNIRNSAANARDGINWLSLRCELAEDAPLNANASHYAVVMRASEQLSNTAQTQFRVIAQAMCRPWTLADKFLCDVGEWDQYVASRNPADWLADLWSDDRYGEGLTDDRIDFATLDALRALWANRQDRFDYTFTTRVDAWSAGQLIASAGRGRMFRRYGVRTLARDSLALVGEKVLTPRMAVAGTAMPLVEKTPSSTSPDGLRVEYVSSLTWDIATVDCPCPGVVTMERPQYERYNGIKGLFQATREGLYHAADMALRTRSGTIKTEEAGLTAAFMLPIWLQRQQIEYGQTGDVAFWNAGALTMSLTERPDWSRAPLYLTLQRPDSTPTTPVPVNPGPDEWSVVLPAAPDFTIDTTAPDALRPVFLLGPQTADKIVKVSSIKDGGRGKNGAQFYDIDYVFDDPRVHQADNALLPGPGDVQDPIALPGDDPGGGTFVVVTLTTHFLLDGFSHEGGGTAAGVQLGNDGSLTGLAEANGNNVFPGEWALAPTDPVTEASLFEVLATTATDHAQYDAGSSAFDVWLNLGTTRYWLYRGFEIASVLNLQIRRVGEVTLQSSANMYITVRNAFEGS